MAVFEPNQLPPIDDLEPAKPIPNRLLVVPGFMDDVISLTASVARYPNKPLAFVGALALMSHLTARVVRTESNLRSNLYLIALGPPSVGKDDSRKVNQAILGATDLGETVISRFGSGEGLQDALKVHPALLAQTDEIAHLFEAMKRDSTGSRQTMISGLLELYTSAGGHFRTRSLAGNIGEIINEPHLSLLGSATPNGFYSSLTQSMMVNGLVARMMVVEAAPRGARATARPIEVSKKIETVARFWAHEQSGNRSRVMRADGNTKQALEDARDQFDSKYGESQRFGNEAAMALWGRAGELCDKLSMIHSLSADSMTDEISLEAALWAHQVAFYHADRLLYRAANLVADTPFGAACNRVVELLRSSESGGRLRGEITRRMNMPSRDLDAILEHLEESRRICGEPTPSGKGKIFRVAS